MTMKNHLSLSERNANLIFDIRSLLDRFEYYIDQADPKEAKSLKEQWKHLAQQIEDGVKLLEALQ